MCGIYGTFYNRPLAPQDIKQSRKAVKNLAHRGPDGSGEFVAAEAGVFLGHRRLKIIDLSEQSSQPMQRDNFVLTYNGEIYNFPALKARLEGMGHHFRSTGDTEVLLESWRRWGNESLNEFDGMFAFGIWDGDHGWLAVDPFSEKQIYYAETVDGIVFSSELVTLAGLFGNSPDIDGHLPGFLTLGYISSPNTIYPNIKRLDPASWVKIHNGKIVDRGRYWSPPAPDNQDADLPKFDARALELVHELLVENVSSRLISDVPLCLFLSSGIDSSLVAALAKKELKSDLEAITVGYPHGISPDESEGARRIAKILDIPHQVLEAEDYGISIAPSVLYDFFGQPSPNITVTSVYQMAHAASQQGFRAGLTGLGGDDIFFGYEKHAFSYRHRNLYNMSEFLRIGLGVAARPISSIFNPARIFQLYCGVRDEERIPALKMPWMIETLRQVPGFNDWCAKTYRNADKKFEFSVARVELMDTMVNSHLPALDLGSMRSSLELRTPFLSRKLCDLMAGYDWGDLMSRGRKWVLKELLSRYLPRDVIDGQKQGFVFPADRFLDQFSERPADIPSIPSPLMDDIWRNRQKPNWRAISTRALILSDYVQRHGQTN
jgi:asparagine synthase (glutamine-hydrolysing)